MDQEYVHLMEQVIGSGPFAVILAYALYEGKKFLDDACKVAGDFAESAKTLAQAIDKLEMHHHHTIEMKTPVELDIQDPLHVVVDEFIRPRVVHPYERTPTLERE
jgi:hypothetical protein